MNLFGVLSEVYPTLLTGLTMTVKITILSLIIALVIVNKGQMEAARSLGLSYAKSMQKIILPQAVRICLPSLVNQFIITLKDSTILYAIGLSEVMYNAKIYVGRTMESFATYTWVAVFFLLIVTVLSFISRYVERRMNA